jgi:hypothetical protein
MLTSTCAFRKPRTSKTWIRRFVKRKRLRFQMTKTLPDSLRVCMSVYSYTDHSHNSCMFVIAIVCISKKKIENCCYSITVKIWECGFFCHPWPFTCCRIGPNPSFASRMIGPSPFFMLLLRTHRYFGASVWQAGTEMRWLGGRRPRRDGDLPRC